MELIREFVQTLVIYSIISSFCIHLLPGKKYISYANFIVGLGYICIILDLFQSLMEAW